MDMDEEKDTWCQSFHSMGNMPRHYFGCNGRWKWNVGWWKSGGVKVDDRVKTNYTWHLSAKFQHGTYPKCHRSEFPLLDELFLFTILSLFGVANMPII